MSRYQMKFNSLGIGALLLSLATIGTTLETSQLRAQEVEGNTNIEEISESEDVTVGEEVTVRGEVEEVEPGVSFVMEEEGFLEGDRVLVINVSGEELPIAPSDDLELQVTGETGMLVLADVESEYGLDLDPELYVDYENQPVIFAQSMVLSPGLEDISEDPTLYYAQEVAVEGEVDEIRSDYTFTLKEDQLIGGDDLLIINATGEPIPTEDEKVVVTGTVRPYIKAEFERDYDLTWDLDIQEEIEAEYSEKPVLVVDSIYTSAEDDGLLE
ncbi:conserved hypothetical protein [Hyella patelloides LEGE 07179]|uniref:Uncharacterized protein n=1 Tax=Hyella patelloides LEGE 07179 TaxID=945734 RepID=A0A563VM01_9CYAN|nr:hypothetical protein [Hyella patelloides]VEP12459.1 conserved hypothetical protein [Hyella patelloides LEGE 07179]